MDFSLPNDFQAIPFEITLAKSKWLVISVYNPHKKFGNVFIENLCNMIDFYLCRYESYIIIGDMNMEPSERILNEFMEDYCLYNLIKEPTCFKSKNGTCIDLILTNKEKSFKFTSTLETGHKLIRTSFKSIIYRACPMKKIYRKFKHFNEILFTRDFSAKLNDILDFDNFYDTLLDTL